MIIKHKEKKTRKLLCQYGCVVKDILSNNIRLLLQSQNVIKYTKSHITGNIVLGDCQQRGVFCIEPRHEISKNVAF